MCIFLETLSSVHGAKCEFKTSPFNSFLYTHNYIFRKIIKSICTKRSHHLQLMEFSTELSSWVLTRSALCWCFFFSLHVFSVSSMCMRGSCLSLRLASYEVMWLPTPSLNSSGVKTQTVVGIPSWLFSSCQPPFCFFWGPGSLTWLRRCLPPQWRSGAVAGGWLGRDHSPRRWGHWLPHAHSAVTRRPFCSPLFLFFFFLFFCCLSGFYLFTVLFLGRLRGLNQSEPGVAPDDPGPAGRVEGPARTALPVHVSRRHRVRQSVADARSCHRAALWPPARSHSGPRTSGCSSAQGHCWQATPFQRSRPRCRTQDVWQTSRTSASEGSRRTVAQKSSTQIGFFFMFYMSQIFVHVRHQTAEYFLKKNFFEKDRGYLTNGAKWL